MCDIRVEPTQWTIDVWPLFWIGVIVNASFQMLKTTLEPNPPHKPARRELQSEKGVDGTSHLTPGRQDGRSRYDYEDARKKDYW